MALVKIRHANVSFDYRDPEMMRQAVENAERVLVQTRKKLAQQEELVTKLRGGLVDLEQQVAADKARKAEQRKLKQTAA